MDTKTMKSYADVVLDAGLGIGPGSNLRITGDFPHRELMYVIAAGAYDRGAKFVRIDYDDQLLARIRVDRSRDEYIDCLSAMVELDSRTYVEEGWSLLRLEGYEDASVMEGADHGRLTRLQRARGPAVRVLREAQMASRLPWCVAPAPTEAWARTVFGEGGTAARLWESLVPILRLDCPDPAAALAGHMKALGQRAAGLTERGFRELHIEGPGTDLKVVLSPDSLWMGGSDTTPEGKVFMPNIPTEEVFTTPDFRGTEGRVSMTRPVRIHGSVVEGGVLEFKSGAVVSCSARKGADALRGYIETDSGSKRLGEVALVDVSSPIWASGLVFDSMLLDENAACHIALGAGYDPAFRGSGSLSDAEKEERGFNVSIGHEDLMIGSDEVSVTGTDATGKKTRLLDRGRFVV
jgi:aminopeptidase